MKVDCKNWVSKGMIAGFAAGALAATVVWLMSITILSENMLRSVLLAISPIAALILTIATVWLIFMYRA